ncbi:Ig-like domain-containing protein [Myxococcota bacterium]|nr:Ig-like domain-containing protein [Myxococcota bacterium]
MLPRSRATLPLLLLLSAPLASAGLLATPTAAHAQASVLAEPLVALVPVDEVVGDGRTATTLHIVAMKTDGTPMTGLTGKVLASLGETGRLEELDPGRYRVTWTPAAVNTATEAELTLRVKPPDGANLVLKAKAQVVPSLAHSVAATANPSQVVLGQDATATVTINLSGGAESTLSGADLAVEASSGTVANVTPLGRGQYSLLYTAPAKLFPHLALVTVSDRRAPGRTVGAFAIPLYGRTAFPVTGLPDASIIVRVAGREFGPVQANAEGKTTVTLTVPPGVNEATVISVKGEQRDERTMDLRVPPTPRSQLFPLAPAVPADGRTATTVRVFVAQPDGKPDGSAKVSFSASTGTFGAVRHEGGGIYAADWTPALSSQALNAQVEVKVEDAQGPQGDTLEVRLLPARPEALALETVPERLPEKDGHFKVRARVTGAAQGRGLSYGAAGAIVEAAPADRGQGFVEAGFRSEGSAPVAVQGVVLAEPSSNPLSRVLVFPSAERVTSDGASQVVLTLLTVDDAGYPVPNTPVALSVTEGDAKLSPNVMTDAHGVAHATLTAGSSRGLVVVQAASGGHTGAAGLLQVPNGATGIDLPISGDAQAVALRSRWEPLVRGLTLPREGAAAAVAAGATTAPSATTGARTLGTQVAALAVSPSATKVAPGQSITLTITAKDGAGAGAPGRQLQVFTNAGSTTTAADKGGGTYTTELTAPAQGTDVIRVTVVSPESGVSTMIEVPVGQPDPVWGIAAAEAAATGPSADPTVREAPVMPTTQPVAETVVAQPATKEKKEKAPPAEAGEHPWLRVQAGFLGGFYSFRQVPFTERGPLYGDRIAFGGGETPAAGSAGLGARAKAWSPGADLFGARVNFRTTRYAVELADFDAVVPDWVNELEGLVLVRYPVDAGSARISPALRIGGAVNDFMIYRQDTTGDTPVLDYGPLIVPSFNVGAEVDLDLDGRFFADLGGTLGLNGGGGLYSTAVGGSLGYAFLDNLYLYGNVDWFARNTGVFVQSEGENQEAGELKDALTTFGAGVGFQL